MKLRLPHPGMDRAPLCALLLLLSSVAAEAAPPQSTTKDGTKIDEEFTVTARRRQWDTEEESDAKHRAEYERLKQKFDPDKPTGGSAAGLHNDMARPIQQRDSPLRDSMR